MLFLLCWLLWSWLLFLLFRCRLFCFGLDLRLLFHLWLCLRLRLCFRLWSRLRLRLLFSLFLLFLSLYRLLICLLFFLGRLYVICIESIKAVHLIVLCIILQNIRDLLRGKH